MQFDRLDGQQQYSSYVNVFTNLCWSDERGDPGYPAAGRLAVSQLLPGLPWHWPGNKKDDDISNEKFTTVNY